MTDDLQPAALEQSRESAPDAAFASDMQQPVAAAPAEMLSGNTTDGASSRWTLSALWETLRRALWPTPEERSAQAQRRITRLSQAIDFSPEAATNYVLRGELFLQIGAFAAAEADFLRALEIAAAQVEEQEWGILPQVLQDRAQEGLAQAQRHKL